MEIKLVDGPFNGYRVNISSYQYDNKRPIKMVKVLPIDMNGRLMEISKRTHTYHPVRVGDRLWIWRYAEK